MEYISGVKVEKLRLMLDDRGWLMEMLRSDWEIFEKFGQAYVTTCYPGVVKAWHYHKGQTCLLYTSPSPRDLSTSRMPSSA